MTHAEALDLLAGAALDDLDDAERATLLAHRVSCLACDTDAAAIDEALADLARSVPQYLPPAGLEARILAAIAATPRTESVAAPATVSMPPTVVQPSAPSPVATDGGRWAWLRRPWFVLATMAVAVVFAVASIGFELRSADLQGRIAVQDRALAVLADPAHRVAPLKNEASGTPSAVAMAVYLPSSTTSYVMAIGLPPTPDGHVYQLWYADAAGVHPLGTYRYDGTGAFVAPFGVDLSGSAAAMVTLESSGGATGDTPGPQVVFGTLPGPG